MRQPSLLLVEDDQVLCSQLADLLRVEGYLVTTVHDGLAALRQLEAGLSPDLLILDMYLDGLDGWDLGAELTDQGRSFPILVVTGDPHPEACAAEVGTNAFLAKPFSPLDLLAQVERLVAPSESRSLDPRTGLPRSA